MLLIYDYLVDVLQKHLDELHLKATITSYINRAWHCYRYIQVHPDGILDSVHYEYINGHWELHFEDYNANDIDKVDEIRHRVSSNISSDGYINWHRSNGRQQGYLSIEEIVEENSFLSIFDSLWNATSGFLLNSTEEPIKPSSENTIANSNQINPIDYLDDIIVGTDYNKPIIRMSSIGDLPYEHFVIPPYQRPYKWRTTNVNQLINDIIAFCDKGTNEYRLGTLVIHKQGHELNIVDGQQRIITLLLLMKELRSIHKELFQGIQIDSFLNKKQFHELISRFHIQENTTAIRLRITEFKEHHVKFLLKQCKFVLVTLYDISEAFQFFDSQNARGKELEPHDLLKAFHLREIPEITNEDKNNISDWENLETARLSNLFLLLFRIKRWIDGYDGREFTSGKVDTFKGPKEDVFILPYRKIYAIAACYTKQYNSDFARRIDHQHMEYPHQIDQVIINGTLFFDMIRYYSNKVIVVHELLHKYCADIATAIDTYAERNRTGDYYTKTLFFASLMFYFDKFGEERFVTAAQKTFAWAYTMRIKHHSVHLATMDNLARDNNSFFRMLHRAKSPTDILNWLIEPVKKHENQQTGRMFEITNILKKLNYLEV